MEASTRLYGAEIKGKSVAFPDFFHLSDTELDKARSQIDDTGTSRNSATVQYIHIFFILRSLFSQANVQCNNNSVCRGMCR